MNIITIGVNDPRFIIRLREAIQRHELIREFIAGKDRFDLYIDAPLQNRIFRCVAAKSNDALTVQLLGHTSFIPATKDVLVIEEGFCHTGDAMKATEGLLAPDKFIESNFRFAQRSDRCGCIQCGRIFPGEEVVERITDFTGDKNGTAICPYCGALAVLPEQLGAEITDNNLWRWFRHMFSSEPLNENAADEVMELLDGAEDD